MRVYDNLNSKIGKEDNIKVNHTPLESQNTKSIIHLLVPQRLKQQWFYQYHSDISVL